MLPFQVSGKAGGDIVSDEVKLRLIESKGEGTTGAAEMLPVETGCGPVPSGSQYALENA
jgi:hypothetical protein